MIRSRATRRHFFILGNASCRTRASFQLSSTANTTLRGQQQIGINPVCSITAPQSKRSNSRTFSAAAVTTVAARHSNHDIALLSNTSLNANRVRISAQGRLYSAPTAYHLPRLARLPPCSGWKTCSDHISTNGGILVSSHRAPWSSGTATSTSRHMGTAGAAAGEGGESIPIKRARGRPRKPKADKDKKAAAAAAIASSKTKIDTEKDTAAGSKRRKTRPRPDKTDDELSEKVPADFFAKKAAKEDKASECNEPALAVMEGDELPMAMKAEFIEKPMMEESLDNDTAEIGACDITFETGKLALLADGAVVARQGDTVVTVSAVSNRKDLDDGGFLPLSVEYRVKAHATGKIPRTKDRREGQPTDDEVLVARAVDRVLRPLFPIGYCFDTQIIANVQALAKGGDPVVLAVNAASAALCVSNIPWDGPAACVRIGRVNGKLVVNPPPDSFTPTGYKDGGGFDLLYAGNEERALMIEMGGGPVAESQVSKALALAHEHLAPLLKAQRLLVFDHGKEKVMPEVDAAPDEELIAEAVCAGWADARYAFAPPTLEKGDGGYKGPTSKEERGKLEGNVLRQIRKTLEEDCPDYPPPARVAAAEEAMKKALRMEVVDFGNRPDGRRADETRPLTAEVDVLPTVHGSGVFTRGETQTLATVALGPPVDSHPQRYLGEAKADPEEMLAGGMYLHYEFPPYCTNETGKLGGINRRMVGHGNLAERAILPVMPDADTFPYTTRVLAEVTMSNGSSSMATACATSLALMDAGVPVSSAVGGISVGLMTTEAKPEGDDIGPYKILTDLQGTEDHYGDMDFKIAGTSFGITAMQLDVKLRGGVPLTILEEAICIAREGRLQVLQTMNQAQRKPNEDLKPRAPRCEIICFEPDRKADLVGIKGQTLRTIETKFGVQVDLSAEGKAVIFSEEAERVDEAVKLVRELVHEITEGEIFKGTVTTVYEYGCLVELLRNQQGLLHVSNMTDSTPAPPARELVEEGQHVLVRVVEVDRLRGLIKLNMENAKLDTRSSSSDLAVSSHGESVVESHQ